MRQITKLFNLNDPGWGRGSNGGNEPPKRPQNRNDGPPDLDEVWRDFNNRLSGLFGRKNNNRRPPNSPEGGGGPNIPPRGMRIGGGVIVGVLVAVWLASGFYIVQEGQVAVVTQFGKYTKTSGPGFQWRIPYPIQNSETVNVSQLRTFEVGFRGGARTKVLPEALMLTTDENIVDMQFVVQYRLRGDGAPDYLFKTRDPDASVRQAAETAMREIVGKRPMDSVLYEGRTEVAIAVQKLMQDILERYNTGVQVESVAIQNVQPPEQVQAAFDDAVKAGQDRERQVNEGYAYANQVVPLASGQASRMLEDAEGYRARAVGDATGNAARFTSILNEYNKAPQIMRERLYLETMQTLYSGSSKVMIDTKNGNNMIYLPLDKIIQQTAQEAGAKPANSNLSLPGGTAPSLPAMPRVGSGNTNSGNANPSSSGNSGSPSSNALTRDRQAR
ncbi:FtsH protease activity modulator HflK [Alcaligenaceae bacterium A4P071]|nr:FtsH protease activity modulator HflK [Alcaligenaceae bacterium B3P038]MDQ2147170.1 FtsH protease activity modulator HflK [Alcaligenaceae bacterium C4P045]MDQ2184507.1 FtsH protease activity modulator HflK [Alcaligenaceae bacterium A4P071]